MGTAPVEDQFKLLELQQLDTVLDVSKRTFEQTVKHPDLAAARNAVKGATQRHEEALARAEEIRTQEESIEREISTVQQRIEKDQRALDSGKGSASTLTNLQHEIQTLHAKKADLESQEIEIMGTSEEHQSELEAAQQEVDSAQAKLQDTETSLRAVLAEVQSKARVAQEERQRLAASIAPALVAQYDKIRARNGGVGVARLVKGMSEGSGMKLAAGDLAEIKAARPEEVVLCPDSGVILVRSEEWN
ncbi:hypothetical protein HD598_000778 [Neomicrococcus aestuarii]|uniref:CT398-like coiled coil hairpin domain-containing protein n=1 Tax=Neomicrococcus aestuarii TaxID=556325 RepID=A0A7W8WY93_9MICC|nr:DNA-binding protein [Neomicrococcus aestuarii]MBB5512091.1 hypothetical protein [Neomicrococcus aestuarii]